MAIPSFFHPEIPPTDNSVRLDARESHHAAGARRLRVGDRIMLLNGDGIIAEGLIEAVTKDALDVAITSRQLVPTGTRSVHMYCALPKGDRQRHLLDMLTQIGITAFTPIHCERSVVKPKAVNLDRLHRITIEACKQSQNPYLPKLNAPVGVSEAIQSASVPGTYSVLADPNGKALTFAGQKCVNAFIGPEGGFTENELQLFADAGIQSVNLSDNILRIETAAVLIASLLLK